MRVVKDSLRQFGETRIEDIVFDPKDRDDIPALLRGLQHIYCDPDTREKVFDILEKQIRPKIKRHLRRPGMSFWRIFVLGMVQKALNCDFDRLRNLVNNHRQLRQMLGHANDFGDRTTYHLQTIIDNVCLLTPEMLEEINVVVVACGHRTVRNGSGASLPGRLGGSKDACGMAYGRGASV